MDNPPEEQWRDLSEHILTDVKEWRRSHPKQHAREIEDEVHTRMSRLEAQLLEATVQESKSRAWSGASVQERPGCPVCRTPVQARGKRQGAGGQQITLNREYGTWTRLWDRSFSPSMRR